MKLYKLNLNLVKIILNLVNCNDKLNMKLGIAEILIHCFIKAMICRQTLIEDCI